MIKQIGLSGVKVNILIMNSLLPITLVLIYTGFAIAEPKFASLENLYNILRQSSYLIMLATAQMIVLITRGFDLSVGSVISMISVSISLVMVRFLQQNPYAVVWAIGLGCLMGLIVGLAVGSFNGACISFLGVNPFVTTLGMLGIGEGFATTLSGGFPISGLPNILTYILSKSYVLGIPAPVILCMAVLTVIYFILNHTILGRSFYIIGSNRKAAYVAGLSTRFNLFFAYVLCSLITAIVAISLTARLGSGEPALGGGLMMQSLMAAIIGGVSLNGGQGHILHCVIGGLFVTVLSNGMNMTNVDSYIQMIVLGIALIAAVFVDGYRRRIR